MATEGIRCHDGRHTYGDRLRDGIAEPFPARRINEAGGARHQLEFRSAVDGLLDGHPALQSEPMYESPDGVLAARPGGGATEAQTARHGRGLNVVIRPGGVQYEYVSLAQDLVESDRIQERPAAAMGRANPLHAVVGPLELPSIEHDRRLGARSHEPARPVPHGSGHSTVAGEGSRIVPDDAHRSLISGASPSGPRPPRAPGR